MDKPPTDPADHAEDFAHRYRDWIDYVVSQRMLDLGIPPERIGMPDIRYGIRHAAFHPHYRNAGGVSPDGRITVESGIFNPACWTHSGRMCRRNGAAVFRTGLTLSSPTNTRNPPAARTNTPWKMPRKPICR